MTFKVFSPHQGGPVRRGVIVRVSGRGAVLLSADAYAAVGNTERIRVLVDAEARSVRLEADRDGDGWAVRRSGRQFFATLPHPLRAAGWTSHPGPPRVVESKANNGGIEFSVDPAGDRDGKNR